jgi:hypothetical protein
MINTEASHEIGGFKNATTSNPGKSLEEMFERMEIKVVGR